MALKLVPECSSVREKHHDFGKVALDGALFTFYGVVLIVAGIFDGPAEIQKAAGININLWMGIGMLILGLLFLLWWRVLPVLRPVDPPSNVVEPSAQHTAETVPGKGTSTLEGEHDG